MSSYADMERTMRDVGGTSLDTPAVLTLEIVSSVGQVVCVTLTFGKLGHVWVGF